MGHSTRGKQAFVLALLFLLVGTARGVENDDTVFLAEPDLSDEHVTFVYDGDVWIAGSAGGAARRLTTAEGPEARPHFSPDGATVAFSANYDGNVDVYTVPVTGGTPQRLTFHGAEDLMEAFGPEGQVLFSSPRHALNAQGSHLFLLEADSPFPARLPVPLGNDAEISGDGRFVAYTIMPPMSFRALTQWKGYRGGSAARIAILDLSDYTVTEVPQPEGRSNDLAPMWVGDLLYFRSDRDGEFNLYSFDPRSSRVERFTSFEDFPVVNANAGGGRIVFERAGRLHVLEPDSGTVSTLRIATNSDLRERRARWASDEKYLRYVSPAPGLRDVALEYRGEIVTLAPGGDVRNLSASPGANDRGPAWSPDGAHIAWFSDASGEYALHVAAADGSDAEPRIIRIEGGAGAYRDLEWSPNARYVSFLDNAYSLFVLDVASGRVRKLSTNDYFGHRPFISHAWSPDSRWLAYTKNTEGLIQAVYLWSVEDGESFPLTDGLVEVSEPVFDPNGRYLYVLASDEAGPVKDWFSQASLDLTFSHMPYAVVLRAGDPSPVPREGVTPAAEDAPPADDIEVRIDFEGIGERIVPLPAADGGMLRDLQVGKSGELYYLRSPATAPAAIEETEAGRLTRLVLRERKELALLGDVAEYTVDAGGGRVLLRQGEQWLVAETDAEIDVANASRLPLDGVAVRIEPEREWRQIAREAWRINRDYFYDPGHHGVDWEGVREKYEPFLAHAATRADVGRVVSWMLSELRVGHSYRTGGETIDEATTVEVGLLGADYRVENGRYRFDKVYGGLNWRPGLRAPLKAPGVSVSAGEYLLAVAGRALTADANPYAAFEHMADRPVQITVGPHADGRDARTVTVVPVADEQQLRYVDWVEENIRRVDQATGGRAGYLHVPDTSLAGHASFKRYFYPQSHKKALIVDDRDNGGGFVADYYIDVLRQDAPVAYWATRYGKDLATPRAAVFGPKVMIINEGAGSGGDLLPWMFRKLDIGPLVGQRTWGGLVGNLEIHTLMDGATVTAPNIAGWTPQDGWIIENEGVAPDIRVDQTPRAMLEGRDAQLEAAIEAVIEALEEGPRGEPERPPYPVRARH